MSSEVEICNLALSHLGQEKIMSIQNPSSRVEELCALHYPISRDATLEARMWTFATTRTTSDTNVRDEWGAAWVHDTPNGWLKVFRAFYNVHTDSLGIRSLKTKNQGVQSDWYMEDGKILAQDSFLYLWGIRQITDTNKFPKTFVKALATRIAADMCMAVTESRTLKADLLSLYEDEIREASSRDGAQGRSEIITATNLLASR